MKINNKICLLLNFLFLTSLIVNFGCSKKKATDDAQQVTAPRPKPKIPEYVPPVPPRKYIYKGAAYRDPLLPGGGGMAYSALAESGEGTETFTSEKLATLQLKGIFRDKNSRQAIAMIGDSSGGSYMLKEGKLYNRRNKIVNDVSGVVGQKSITLICNDIKVELSLKKSEEEKE